MRALDLFCGGGGAALGLLQAGFDAVVGIDIKDHSRVYPGDFILGDALKPPVRLEDFDFVWASPPCQFFSVATPKHLRDAHPNHIPVVRSLLKGHPYTVIENVVGAPINPDIILTGPMFGLNEIERRRHFEVSWDTLSPAIVKLKRVRPPAPIYKNLTYQSEALKHWRRRGLDLPFSISVAEAREAMGITTQMTAKQLSEAVPPAYAKYIGKQAIQRMKGQ